MLTDRKVAAVIDLDHTLTKRDTYLAFLFHGLRKRPSRLFQSAILPFAVIAHWAKLRDSTWLKETFLSAILGDATQEQIACWSDSFVRKVLHSGLRKRATEVIEMHRTQRHHLIMATASFDFYAEKLAGQLHFDAIVATQPAWDAHGRLLGILQSRNCYGLEKVARLNTYYQNDRNSWFVIAYSDDHRDLPMLEWADYPVVVNPTPKLKAIAIDRKYEIQNWDERGHAPNKS